VTTAATALAQPTVTRALKTLNRGGIVVRDRHIDGEQIVFVELTATTRGAAECLPTAAGSAFPG
jgi:DNA-binding MarR family transcriptional regulator